MTPIVATIFLAVLCAIYLLPAIIAGVRGHASAWGIFALNLLLGWTGLVWIVALIWALSNKGQTTNQSVIVHNHTGDTQPPQPAQPIYIPVPQSTPTPVMPSTTAAASLIGEDTRSCPVCAETVKAAAIKCRFCGETLSPTLISQAPER